MVKPIKLFLLLLVAIGVFGDRELSGVEAQAGGESSRQLRDCGEEGGGSQRVLPQGVNGEVGGRGGAVEEVGGSNPPGSKL